MKNYFSDKKIVELVHLHLGYKSNFNNNSKLLLEFKDLKALMNLAVETAIGEVVADALENAAKICDDYANSNFGSLVDSGQNGAYVCSKAIRALIKRNAKEGE